MFIFPITSLAIAALMLIHHIDGKTPMSENRKALMSENEAIKQFLANDKLARFGVRNIELPKFDPAMVDKAAKNYDALVFTAKLMKSPGMSNVVLKFYQRLYDERKMTIDEMKKIAELLSFADEGKHFKSVEDGEVNLAVISLFNQHTRKFYQHLPDLYSSSKSRDVLKNGGTQKEALPEKKEEEALPEKKDEEVLPEKKEEEALSEQKQ